jgi:hypothetical protein
VSVARVSARIAACIGLVLASAGMMIVALSTPSGAKTPRPAIALTKTASPVSFVGPGTVITYNYKVTNTGNVTLDSVGVTDPMNDLSAISCTTTTLAAAASETCTATYTTTENDFNTGSVSNTGTATGTSPQGMVVTATSSVTVPQLGMTPSSCATDGAQGCLATIPCSTGPCPTVDVSPNTGLSDGQNVSIKVTNFASTDSFRVALCSGLTSATDPSCLGGGEWEGTGYNPISVPVADNAAQQNLTTVTYPAFLDPSGEGNNLLPALDILDLNNNTPGFYCDDTVDPCDIVVTYEDGQGPIVGLGPPVSASNSVVIPLTFSALDSGCPANTPVLNTDSSTSVAVLMPTFVDATCNGPDGVVALNTIDDNASVVSDYAAGGSAVAFIDNPMDPTEMTPLQGKSYALVPVAVSASSVSFLAGDVLNGQSIPVSTYNLTPNMVAGLINSAYESPEGNPTYITEGGVQEQVFEDSDNLTSALATAGVPCTLIYECQAGNINWLADNLDAFDLLNPLSADAVANAGVTPQQFGSFMSDVPSGSSYETTDWLCHAPNPALTVNVFETGPSGDPVATPVAVNDPNAAATTFTTAPQSAVWPPSGDSRASWVFPTCDGISNFPSISGTSSSFSAAQSPALQAYKMRGFAYGSGQLPQPINEEDPVAAFGIMDSSEASFYGLGEASLENASGNFVAPTALSVQAGLAAAKLCTAVSPTCPANTYEFNWSNPDPTAYPMPDITYAIVPTAGVNAATTTAISNLLTNMIHYSSSASGTLPAGYYPMPAGMANAALAALHAALYGSPASAGASSGGSSSLSSVYTIPRGSGPIASVPSTISTLPSSLTASATQVTPVAPSVSSKTKAREARQHSPVIPVDLSTVILGTAGRFLLPSALVVAFLCLVGGLLIQRRVRARSNRGLHVAGENS